MKKWLGLIKFIVPIVLSAVNPKLAPLGGIIVHGIGEAEKMHGATGQEKLAHAMTLVTDSAEAINAAAGNQIVDPAMVQDTAAHVISTVVSAAKLIHSSADDDEQEQD